VGALDPVKRAAATANGLAISEVLRTGTARLSIAANHVRQLSGNDELAGQFSSLKTCA
jgi:hypothetical protein